jgi:hypothetical protein
MTEAEWLTATDPEPMLEFIYEESRERKLLLLAVACCRSVLNLLTEHQFLYAVDFIERYTDGLENVEVGNALDVSLATLFHQCYGNDFRKQTAEARVALMIHNLFGQTPEVAVDMNMRALRYLKHQEVGLKEVNVFLCHLFRDIFGNPFRPVTINSTWFTSTVLALATGIYQEKAFDRMPILADALMDASCDNEDILNHCRQAGEHVRGCWVVDLLLSKQ